MTDEPTTINGLNLYRTAVNDVQTLEGNMKGAFTVGERIALINAKAQLVRAWSALTPQEQEWVVASENPER